MTTANRRRTVLVAAFLLTGISGVSAQDVKPKIEDLAFLAGCWELNVPQRNMTITEQWMKPAGATMFGMSRTVSGTKTVMWESLRIESTDTFSYIARPSSKSEDTAFKLLKYSPKEVVFENLANDFPQRIIYRNSGGDALFARIEGTQNGKLNGMDIPMKRVKCE